MSWLSKTLKKASKLGKSVTKATVKLATEPQRLAAKAVGAKGVAKKIGKAQKNLGVVVDAVEFTKTNPNAAVRIGLGALSGGPVGAATAAASAVSERVMTQSLKGAKAKVQKKAQAYARQSAMSEQTSPSSALFSPGGASGYFPGAGSEQWPTEPMDSGEAAPSSTSPLLIGGLVVAALLLMNRR